MDAQFLTPLADPPFMAVRCVPITIEAYGPIEVSERMNVLGQDGREIPGLYAAGAVAAGRGRIITREAVPWAFPLLAGCWQRNISAVSCSKSLFKIS